MDEAAVAAAAVAAAAAAAAAAEGAANIAVERHYLVHQKSWEDQINWESTATPKLPYIPWYSAQKAPAPVTVKASNSNGGAASNLAAGGGAAGAAGAAATAAGGVAGAAGAAASTATIGADGTAVAAAGGGAAAGGNAEAEAEGFDLGPEFLTPLVEVAEGKAVSVFEPTNSKVMDGECC